MAFLERRRLQNSMTLSSDSATWQFKLPRMGDLAALEFFVDMTNGATSNITEHVYDAIDKIELIANGNFVIYSLTGQQARQWSHAFLKQRPRYVRDESASAVQRAHVYIPFGLTKNDPNHWLPLSRFQDLELRITYSFTAAATGWATGTTGVTVYGYFWIMGTPGNWDGYLRLTEQTYFSSAASGDEIYDLPVGNDIVGIGLRVFETSVDPHSNIDAVEVDVNHGSWIPATGEFEDLNAMYSAEMGIDTEEYGYAFRSNTDVFDTWVGSIASASIQTVQDAITVGTTDRSVDVIDQIDGGQITLTCATVDAATTAADAANTADHTIFWNAKAKYGLGNMLIIPFGLHNVGQALPSAQFGNVRVKMTQGNAGAECRLSLLELARI